MNCERKEGDYGGGVCVFVCACAWLVRFCDLLRETIDLVVDLRIYKDFE